MSRLDLTGQQQAVDDLKDPINDIKKLVKDREQMYKKIGKKNAKDKWFVNPNDPVMVMIKDLIDDIMDKLPGIIDYDS